MINHLFTNRFTEGSVVSDIYVITDIRRGVTKSGKPYLSANLLDARGSVAMIAWEYEGGISPADNGELVAVTGLVTMYQDRPQLRVEQLTLQDAGGLSWEDIEALVPSAPIDADVCSYYVWKMAQSIQDPELNRLCNTLLEGHWEMFTTIPAGKSVHHAFRYGLLMHTADMLVLAEAIAAHHVDTVNRDLLVCGVLLHDFGKILEFELSPTTGLVKDYSPVGKLIGHSCLGAIEAAKAAAALGISSQTEMLVQHMLLSHHGNPAFGAAKEPMILEAEILHGLDMLDSRREIYTENLTDVQPGSCSCYIPALEHAVYRSALLPGSSFVSGENPGDTYKLTIPAPDYYRLGGFRPAQ